jgi:transcriptional regulator with XRE-family HTH domain
VGESVGDRIAQARRLLSVVLNRDVSQDELAQMAGLAAGSMSQWEKGHKRPSRDTLKKILGVLHRHGMTYITLGYLDYGEGEGPPSLGSAPVKPQRSERPPIPKRESKEATIASERQKKANPRKRA